MKAKATASRAKATPVKTTKPAKAAPGRGKSVPTRKAAATDARPGGKAKAKPAAPSRVSSRSSASPSKLLRAGLNALSLPRAESAVADGLSKIADSFGLKKLEDVFDQRVAAAMERIGYPSVKDLQALSVQVAELIKLLRLQKTRGQEDSHPKR